MRTWVSFLLRGGLPVLRNIGRPRVRHERKRVGNSSPRDLSALRESSFGARCIQMGQWVESSQASGEAGRPNVLSRGEPTYFDVGIRRRERPSNPFAAVRNGGR